jgi:hypothetical protein
MLALEVQMLHFQLQKVPRCLCVSFNDKLLVVAQLNGTSPHNCKLADGVILLRAPPVARSHLCSLAYHGTSSCLFAHMKEKPF